MLRPNFYLVYFVASIIFAIVRIAFLSKDCLWFVALVAISFESSNRAR